MLHFDKSVGSRLAFFVHSKTHNHIFANVLFMSPLLSENYYERMYNFGPSTQDGSVRKACAGHTFVFMYVTTFKFYPKM